MAGGPTVVAVDPLDVMPLIYALIVEVPIFRPLARPPVVMLMTVASEDAQATCEVMSLCFPSLNVPVAVNCCVAPSGIVVAPGSGVIAMLCNFAAGFELSPHATVIPIEASTNRHCKTHLVLMSCPLQVFYSNGIAFADVKTSGSILAWGENLNYCS